MKKVTTVVGAITASMVSVPTEASVDATPTVTPPAEQPQSRVEPSTQMAELYRNRYNRFIYNRWNMNRRLNASDKWKDGASPFARDGAFSNFASPQMTDPGYKVNPVLPNIRNQQIQRMKINKLTPVPGLEGSDKPTASLDENAVQTAFDRFKPT